jgi:hypothetical protein
MARLKPCPFTEGALDRKGGGSRAFPGPKIETRGTRTVPRLRCLITSQPVLCPLTGPGDGGAGGGEERGAQGGKLQGGDFALGEFGGAAATEAELGERFFEDAATVEVEVEAAREDEGNRVGHLGAEEDDGGRRGGSKAGGEEADVFGIAIFPGAIDEAQAAVDLDFDSETGGVVVGELFAEALAVFGGGFGVGFEALDGGRDVSSADGKRSRGLAEDGGVSAGGMDGAQAADELDAIAAADFFGSAQEEGADLAGGAEVGSAAGIAVDAGNLDDAYVAGAVGQLAQVAGGEHGFGFGARDVARRDGAVLGDDVVDEILDVFEAMGDGAAGEVDGGSGFAEVEGDGGRVELAEEDGGEEVLAGVLLHVVEAAGPVDAAFDFGADGEWLADEVPDLAVLVFFNGFDADVEGCTPGRNGAEEAGVIGLAAAGGVEGGAVEGDLPDGFTSGSGELADVDNSSGERLQKRIGIIEPFGDRHSLTPGPAIWGISPGQKRGTAGAVPI